MHYKTSWYISMAKVRQMYTILTMKIYSEYVIASVWFSFVIVLQ